MGTIKAMSEYMNKVQVHKLHVRVRVHDPVTFFICDYTLPQSLYHLSLIPRPRLQLRGLGTRLMRAQNRNRAIVLKILIPAWELPAPTPFNFSTLLCASGDC